MTSERESCLLTMRFSPRGDGAVVDWEADALGVRHSTLSPPYRGDDVALVIGALDVLQYPNYLDLATTSQQQLFTFSVAEQECLRSLGLWDGDAERVRADAHQCVGQSLYRALCDDPAGARAMDTVRNHAVANGQLLALRLCFPPPMRSNWPRSPGSCSETRGQSPCC